MKFAISVALVVLLLGMPLGCILAACQVVAPPHPCCPRTNTSVKCPYDALDSAKVATIAAVAVVPMAAETGIAPANRSIVESSPTVTEDRSDLYILNRILRI
jgi:xanthine/uracil permease